MRKIHFLSALYLSCVAACTPNSQITKSETKVSATPVIAVQPTPPHWSKDAVIYQINTRQYSEAGTFSAVEADLDRIKSLGVDILWLMPIHPIGEVKRKGSLGSPYAVKDFQAVNPELGTLEDFKSLVDSAHEKGMKVIIDWVANHTAWDNHLINQHPDWYTRNAKGEMQHPPETDWFDVADLDYSQQGLRDYMTESLLYWVEEVGIDGYRCDVAGMVPTDFWNSVRPELERVKPIFMLAEWQEPELHERAFDASYAWRWKEIMQDIVKGKANASDMAGYYADYQSAWPDYAMRMAYTSNHDQNTWDGTPFEIYGEAYSAAIALSFIGEGIPLIYNGQEACNDNRLAFFEKDLIAWNFECPLRELFTKLVALKTNHPALHNGSAGGRLKLIKNNNAQNVFTFERRKNDHVIVMVINLSSSEQSFQFSGTKALGKFTDHFSNETINLTEDFGETLMPWQYKVYVK